MRRAVEVVAHTHWDREWYAPFETFQQRLVDVVDDVLSRLEADPRFEHFMLDGQVAALDDYLSVRPSAEGRLRRLAREGRLATGPWYVLMDEFCVSGETIVRNLQLGISRSGCFGEPMPVGYLPDMFGHIAQMPQILRHAGLEHAVVWRGVPRAVDRTAFWWRSPDGSQVRTEYLPVGYANGAFLPTDADALVRRIAAHAAEVSPLYPDDSQPILVMNGGDHQHVQAGLPSLLDRANRLQDRYDFRQTRLIDYLRSAPTDDLPTWTGELRSSARANLLMGVLSNRVDIKAAAARAERALEREAEPLAVLWLPPALWPQEALAEAWLAMIRNSAHDSVCACSADTVGRAVLSRYDRAAALAGVVIERALAIVTVAPADAGQLVVNASPAEASGVVEVVLPGNEVPAGTQIVELTAAAVEERAGVGADLARLLAGLTEDGWLHHGRGTDASLTVADDAVEVRVMVDEAAAPRFEMAAVMAEAWAQAGAHRDHALRIRVDRRASMRVAARVTGIPGYGWAPFDPDAPGDHGVRSGSEWLDNGRLRVEFESANGTLTVNGVSGFDRLVDGGDTGDTYSYSPPAHDIVVDRPEAATVELIEHGPVRGLLRVTRTFDWPARLAGDRRVGRSQVEVVTDVELRAGENLLRLTTSFDNPCRDHRLRAVFPLPRPTDRTTAECAFATVIRGEAEGGPGEAALPTFPARRWVQAGGLTVTHEGLLEYELVQDGRALALTLLRATGMLSRPAPALRPNAAGPAVPLDGPQLVGRHRVRYALALGDVDPWRLADLAWLPLHVVRAEGGGPLPASGSRLAVTGAEVSALHRVDGAIEMRVFNPSTKATRVRVPGHSGVLVDLRGRPTGSWDQTFPVGPWGIATARLDAATLDAPTPDT
jgi:alpha-mannosidase